MIQIKPINTSERLSKWKRQYVEQKTAPLDGMWLCGFVPMATHYGFFEVDELVGFFCLNEDGYLLQFYVCPSSGDESAILFDTILKVGGPPSGKINGAFASTAEPQYLSLCLDRFPVFKVNALMYQLDPRPGDSSDMVPDRTLNLVGMSQLAEVVEFAKTNIGAPEEWLMGYYTNLIERHELFTYRHDGRLLATGESRGYVEYQEGYADLGVIVDESARGKGVATQVLKELVTLTQEKGVIPICSTEKENIGAQKAINHAGFLAQNRIIQFDV